MADEPFFLKLLAKLGVNTTQLRWKLYQFERRADRAKKSGGLPSWLQWLRYEHKLCRHCGAVNDRAIRQCHRCGRRIPSMLGYRAYRFLGLMLPAGAPVTASSFLAVVCLFYAAAMLIQGVSVIFPGSSNPVLYLFGAFTNRTDEGADWWRWLAFSLAHANIIHIGFNVFATTQIGPIVENEIGRYRMLVVITGCQIAAAVATWFWYAVYRNESFFTIGASGWVFGLIGFGVAMFHRLGEPGRMHRNALMHWAIYGVIFGLIIGANNSAHIGGFLGGALLAYLPEAKGHARVRIEEKVWKSLAGICLAVWIVAIANAAWYVITNYSSLPGK